MTSKCPTTAQNVVGAMTCSTCGNPAVSPRKRLVGGAIVEQCVDKIHDAAVLGRGPSNETSFLRAAIKRFRIAGVSRFHTGRAI